MSAQIDVDRVLAELKAVAATATNEEEFKINAERILYNEVLSKLNLQPGRYEYTFISGGRSDALYGHLIIEYKVPGKLSGRSDIAKAKEQMIGYIKKEAEREERYRFFLGVILCDRIAFVRYDPRSKSWPLRGPYDLNRESVLRLVEAIRGLRRKKLAVDELLRDFGPGSELTRRVVKTLYDKLTIYRSPKTEALFNDWKRVFSQVCAYSPEKLKGIEAEYEIAGSVDYGALLFSIHTYYAFLMKLLGAEIAYLYGAGKFLKSYVAELEDAHMRGLDSLKSALEELESGGVFRNLLNITNFVEGDYFSWYLDELDKSVVDALCEIAKKLSDYEPATPVLEPKYTRDMLKRLYQNLVPKKIRHDLGEYYTPDWLAELVLNEVGITAERLEQISKEKNDTLAPLSLKILDPACGSGTFLILAIKRLREYAEKHYLEDTLADYMLKNVVGFDLNPLAVLAARTNYLLAIADLLVYVKGSIEIPVYLADSLLVETKQTLTGIYYIVRTYVGEFRLPKSIVDRGLLSKLLEAVDRYVRLRYRPEDFKQGVKDELGLSEEELQPTEELYSKFLRLEEEGKDHVWIPIIKNAFAPLVIPSSHGKFDFVIGNPPWINWENLPENYRERSRLMWDRYRLIAKRKGKASLGKVKRDIAMLFIYTSIDRYLKEGGKFGFLTTQTVFKSMAGEGFRNFWIPPEGPPFKVTRVHDLVELLPFERAQNRTAAIFCVKGVETRYPVPYILWKGPTIDQELSLEEVLRITSRSNLEAKPLMRKNGPWSTLKPKAHEAIEKVTGASTYRAFEGVNTALNSAYWVRILDNLPDGSLLIENVTERAKRGVRKFQAPMERDLVYPLLRGKDIERWKASSEIHMVLPTDGQGNTIPITNLRVKYPKVYSFFNEFFEQLVTRSGEPYKSQLKSWREKPKEIAEKRAPPFYMVFNANPSLAPYKVVWKEVSPMLNATVIGPKDDQFVGHKSVVPDHTIVLVPCQQEDESHFICAVLNSSIARLLVNSYLHLHPSPHIMDFVRIPKYHPTNRLHKRLSNLSKDAHRLKGEGKENEVVKIEDKIDTLVAQLYGLTDEELREIKESLAILEGKEIVEEEIIEE